METLAGGRRSNTVLVVDDDRTVRDLMRHFLAREGLDVVTARDGEEALRMARDVNPAIITLDVLMPGLDGWSVLQALKLDAKLAAIPVVMLTILDEMNKGYALGASDYLTKPIDRDRLRATLEKFRVGQVSLDVLVIDDNDTTRQMLRRLLEGEGCGVTQAENGRVALAQMASTMPDLILLDLMMPEMDGFAFLDELRKKPEYAAVPVVVVTAAELTEEDHRRLNGGVEMVLQKTSYSREELLDQLRDLVHRHLNGAETPATT